ncbi:MAG TPA: hypothetical protein VJS63_12700 [Bradyrhizobium sp.]|nr:hypothetical protein [Bradyrhizobium sp.]
MTASRRWLLSLAAGFGLAAAWAANAQTPPAGQAAETPAEEAAPAPDGSDVDMSDIDPEKLDWSQLNVDASTLILPAPKGGAAPKGAAGTDASWSSSAKPNGAAAVSVKQSLSPFWDTRIGADMTVVNQSSIATSADVLRQKYSPDGLPSQSSGAAWAAITAPGVGSIWDKTAVEARVDPSQEQSKLGTSLSKSLPLGEQYSLTLQNGYNLIQQGYVPVPGIVSHPARNYETDRSAKLSLTDTGTSFIAGQTLSSTDDKWLSKFGAEQKLFEGVTISGSVGETVAGATNKSISAGFKRSW